jgi:micrococcal nuclease
MDTPETKDPRKPVQCFGKEASKRTEQLLPPSTPIVLVYDVDRFDRYGRTLAYVYRASDGLFVNASLVRDGYAQVDTVPPDVAHADDFVALQRAARDANRGLWSACR